MNSLRIPGAALDVGIDLAGWPDRTVAYIARPNRPFQRISLSRFELVIAEAAADRFDGLGTPMVDSYRP